MTGAILTGALQPRRMAHRAVHHHRLRPGHVVDCHRDADPDRAERALHALRREVGRRPALPGSRHRAAASAGAVAGAGRRDVRLERLCRSDKGAGGARRPPTRRPLSAQSVLPAARLDPGAGGDGRSRPPRRARRCGAHGFRRHVDGHGRLHCRPDAGGFGVPPRAGSRHRALPQHPARPLLHGRRHVDQRRQYPLRMVAHRHRGARAS